MTCSARSVLDGLLPGDFVQGAFPARRGTRPPPWPCRRPQPRSSGAPARRSARLGSPPYEAAIASPANRCSRTRRVVVGSPYSACRMTAWPKLQRPTASSTSRMTWASTASSSASSSSSAASPVTAIGGLNWKSRPNTEANEGARLPRPRRTTAGRSPHGALPAARRRRPNWYCPAPMAPVSCKWRITSSTKNGLPSVSSMDGVGELVEGAVTPAQPLTIRPTFSSTRPRRRMRSKSRSRRRSPRISESR